MKKAVFHWSGGKDSAMALHQVLKDKSYEVLMLLTSLSQEYDRVSMHGVRKELLYKQVELLDIPLDTLYLPSGVSMASYDLLMEEKLKSFQKKGIAYAIYGDIFLEDLRRYREVKLAQVGMQGVFPLWKKDTRALLEEFIELGFKAVVVCTNARLLDESFVGRVIDASFIRDLPLGVDPAGENGEFHSFVFDGPIFSEPIPIQIGEKILRSYASDSAEESSVNWDQKFWYCDLMLCECQHTLSAK
ncbi:MAG: diphthine--ammonia ligase [Microscillaceae bacterium]|nr:diphthine--ammonia ligase [Microscillaceae bacterium]